jgi:(1->4)-alpha-D-glucan 1-alpha-D-glucosylmutase
MIATILSRTLGEVERRRRLPESTYRLQFHASFTFRAAADIVPYLHALGITHLYASPYLKARHGSMHGYDITDHRALNPEIGTPADYDALVAALHQAGLGQILDTVPNHMGIHASENPWWHDVLENGPASPYARYFDIAWFASPRPELHGKLLLPILGEPYGQVLESQQLHLSYANGAFFLNYYDHSLPVAPRSYGLVLVTCLEELKQQLGENALPLVEYQSILTAVRNLPPRAESDPGRLEEHQREKEVVKRRLAQLCTDSAEIATMLERTVARFNGTPGQPHTFDLLDRLLEEQAYRLSFWRVASDEINYRRFFDVNDLAALSMEREEVFTATHELIFALLQGSKVDGLRIDHPDGLYDPKQYLWRLQHRYLLTVARGLESESPQFQNVPWENIEPELSKALERHLAQLAERGGPWPLYVVVEKILGGEEQLRADWATYGTSGYDFLNQVSGLFVDAAQEGAFTRLYHDWSENETPFARLVYQNKVLITAISMSSELNMLAHQLDRLAQQDRWSRDFTLHAIRQGLRAVIACFPVYRSYITEEGFSDADRHYVQRAVRLAKINNRAMSPALFDFIRDLVLQKPPRPDFADELYQAEQRRFAGKFQQVTAPVMAKGLEDTAFYVYNRLISLNEVGGDPSRFGQSPAGLHRYLQQRQARWPWAMSTTATHDTKRSGDVRARIHVLSEMPEEWLQALGRWSQLNQEHRVAIEEDVTAPDPNEEYLLYQTLLGAWPLEPTTPDEYNAFVQRTQEYTRKVLHEAKVHTSWINPDPAYDAAVSQFIARILDPKAAPNFLGDFRAFQHEVSHFGLFSALSQVLLKTAAPGVPDTYQGTEIWDFSLVDPDNRRPVDFARRRQMLADLDERVEAAGRRLPHLAEELTRTKEDGRIKLYVLSRVLRYRREHPGLLSAGAYVPLECVGAKAEHAFAFLRQQGEEAALVVAPRLYRRLLDAETKLPLGRDVWQDTELVLPKEVAQASWRNLFTGETLQPGATQRGPALPLAEIVAHFPVALLTARLEVP